MHLITSYLRVPEKLEKHLFFSERNLRACCKENTVFNKTAELLPIVATYFKLLLWKIINIINVNALKMYLKASNELLNLGHQKFRSKCFLSNSVVNTHPPPSFSLKI